MEEAVHHGHVPTSTSLDLPEPEGVRQVMEEWSHDTTVQFLPVPPMVTQPAYDEESKLSPEIVTSVLPSVVPEEGVIDERLFISTDGR